MRSQERLLWIACGAVGIAYLLQLRSPLRLNNDVIALLGMALNATDGPLSAAWSSSTHYSGGYPFLVSILIRGGLASSATLISLNIVSVVGGLVFWAMALQSRSPAPQQLVPRLLLVSLTSWVLIKHITLPMADSVFFGLCLFCVGGLLMAVPHGSPPKPAWLLIAILAAGLAFLVRAAGVALIPPLLVTGWKAMAGRRRLMPQREKPRNVYLGMTVLGVFTAAALVFELSRETSYPAVWIKKISAQSTRELFLLGSSKLSEVGSALGNVHGGLVPRRMEILLPLAGVVAISLLIATALRRGSELGPQEVFSLSYGAMILAWPWVDSRFWMPIVPILWSQILHSVESRAEHSRLIRIVFHGVVAAWVASGVVALGYSTRISWSGEHFAERYGDGSLRRTYEFARTGRGDPAGVRYDGVRVLGRFGEAVAP